ncbi:MAG: argininosuccinate synthase [Defluviitaleaceae bacterium]|nr:argininosuccinate synthase [Defluviitaleaceae bacterium]
MNYKILLAYSGGLDTSIMIHWLKENYKDCEIIAFCADVGQGISELDGLKEKAINTGASKIYIEDIREEFVTNYIFPTVKASAKYEGEYLLGTSFARPVIAKKMAEIAQKEGVSAIAHGCTGKGNDQVRFEIAIKHFLPNIKIIAPWREWEIKGREDAIAYAQKHNIPLKINLETNYSKDKNLWHLSHEGLDLENPANEAPTNKKDFLEISVSPENAPDKPTYINIGFEKGIPVNLNNKKVGPVELVEELNKIGGANGIGILDIVENRLIGMKSRGVYETPGGTILYKAHQILESLCLDRDTKHYKEILALKFAELVYNGLWFSPLREAISAFVDKTQERMNGNVKLKLYKGNITSAGISSPYSLYDAEMVTFEEDNVYNQKDAEGFINLFGLPTKVRAMLDEKNKEAKPEWTAYGKGDLKRD